MDKIVYIPLLMAIAAPIAVGLLVLATSIRVHKGTSPHRVRHLADIPEEARARLRGKTIFFGHQSVGYDILNGMRDLVAGREFPGLNIVETKDGNDVEGAMLAHARMGRNLQPESKIDDFVKVLEGGVGEKVDFAFLKFCFVDIGKTSSPDAILSTYCKAVDSLRLRYPRVTFVHVTVPLCGPPGTAKGVLKAGIKRLIGRPAVLDENEVRERYNLLLRERFSGQEPLFDLALYETLGPEGLRHYGSKDGREIPILARPYTDDGGHLNAVGRRHVAEQLLIALLNLTSSPEGSTSSLKIHPTGIEVGRGEG